ncbi:hypothetical protein ACFRJ3_11045 [Streptomyces sp. NPDC056696]|uniref:hypothetical protein n=1 Tax=unclassified Streptomyces TaxID=2593676 RepID=UPI0036AE6203
MRYLVEQFAIGALRRGQGIEQFLGAVDTPAGRGIQWVDIEPTQRGYVVTLHAQEDVGSEQFCDLLEFPPLDPDDEFGRNLSVTNNELAALKTAETQTGARRDRWLNAGMAGDDYRDYIRAGRRTL